LTNLKDDNFSQFLDYNTIITNLVDRNIERISSNLIGRFKKAFTVIKVDLRISFIEYLKKSFNKYSKLKTIIYRTDPKFIYDFFEFNDLRSPLGIISSKDSNDILNISNYLIISGIGGLGKSVLLKHVFLDQLMNQKRIPVFIELKEFNEFEGSFYSFIQSRMINLGFKDLNESLKYALKSGVFVLLFDGFDEVHSSKRNTLNSQINELCDNYPNNHFIISSRPDEIFLSFSRFTELIMMSLNKDQAINLIAKLDFDESIKLKFQSELRDNLYDKHESFASNPLLLNIMLLTFHDYATIPEKIHIFYSNAFDTLYFKHDATKAGYKREFKTNLPYDIFKMIFAEFSFRSYVKGLIEFNLEQIIEISKPLVEKYKFDILDFLWDLEHSVCLLYLDGFSYKFTHRSFQEFFTSFYLKEQDDYLQTKICNALIDSDKYNYSNVFYMLYDMSNDRFEKNVLLTLLNRYEVDSKLTLKDFIKKFNLNLVYLSKHEYMTVQNEYIDDLDDDSYFLAYNGNAISSIFINISCNYTYLLDKSEIDYKNDEIDKFEMHEIVCWIGNVNGDENELIPPLNHELDLSEFIINDNHKIEDLVWKSWFGTRFRIIVKLKNYLDLKYSYKINSIENLLNS
jgi:predicted NACHT family NTPase